jgi:hypothetical protein
MGDFQSPGSGFESSWGHHFQNQIFSLLFTSFGSILNASLVMSLNTIMLNAGIMIAMEFVMASLVGLVAIIGLMNDKISAALSPPINENADIRTDLRVFCRNLRPAIRSMLFISMCRVAVDASISGTSMPMKLISPPSENSFRNMFPSLIIAGLLMQTHANIAEIAISRAAETILFTAKNLLYL